MLLFLDPLKPVKYCPNKKVGGRVFFTKLWTTSFFFVKFMYILFECTNFVENKIYEIKLQHFINKMY